MPKKLIVRRSGSIRIMPKRTTGWAGFCAIVGRTTTEPLRRFVAPSNWGSRTAGLTTTSAMHCFEKGEVDEAITAYRQAIALNPKDGRYPFGLGEALRRTGQLAEAIEVLQIAVTA